MQSRTFTEIKKEFNFIIPSFIKYLQSNYNIKKKFTYDKISDALLNFLENEKQRCSSSTKTDFNEFQKLGEYGIIKLYLKRDIKEKAYLELINETHFNIRNQDQFHFRLVSALYRWFKKNNKQMIIDELFIDSNKESNFYTQQDKIKIESTEKTSNKLYRTDMSFNINNNVIVVEYLEKHHECDKIIDHSLEKSRAFKLICDNKNINYKIVHIAYFWEKDWYDKDKFNKFVNYIGEKIVDYYLISNENEYCIENLTSITNNRVLSEQIYLAHNSDNKPVVKLDIIQSQINWAKSINSKIKMQTIWYNKFVDKVKQIQLERQKLSKVKKINNDAFDDFELNDESDCESVDNLDIKTDIEEIIYYKVTKDGIFLTYTGLHLYISLEPQYLNSMLEYDRINKFYRDITSGLIKTIKKIRKKETDLMSDLISGLSD
jgi:hypothetical protein